MRFHSEAQNFCGKVESLSQCSKLNVHKMLIKHPGCHLNVLGTFNLVYVSIGKGLLLSLTWKDQQDFYELH